MSIRLTYLASAGSTDLLCGRSIGTIMVFTCSMIEAIGGAWERVATAMTAVYTYTKYCFITVLPHRAMQCVPETPGFIFLRVNWECQTNEVIWLEKTCVVSKTSRFREKSKTQYFSMMKWRISRHHSHQYLL